MEEQETEKTLTLKSLEKQTKTEFAKLKKEIAELKAEIEIIKKVLTK